MVFGGNVEDIFISRGWGTNTRKKKNVTPSNKGRHGCKGSKDGGRREERE